MEGVRSVPELRGIIPNSFAHIFGAIAKADTNTRFLVRVSYLEIYNEEVRDLLGKDKTASLDVKERPDIGVYVKDLSSFVVHSPNEMDKLMSFGNKNRVTGATNMNEHSSRSHAIYTVTIECSENTEKNKTLLRQGKLHLVDLAGSERQAKTGATGKRLQEANKINLSLTTLGNVISALVDGKSTHVPYRNSKLTRLLQDSLGGNSKTAMIANISPSDYNYDESLSTLRYANRAKNIKNKAKVNEDPKDAMLRQFQKEIEQLRKQLEEGGIPSDPTNAEDGEGDADEDDDDVIVGPDGQERRVNKSKQSSKKLSKQKMAEIQRMIEADRRKLEEQKDMALEERNRVQEEAAGKRRKLRKLSTMYLQAKSELEDLKNEHVREMEGLLDNIRQLGRELAHNALIIDRFIPQPYQALIQQNVQWNEEIGEWQLKCIAYTGNNMRKPEKETPEPPVDLSHVYLTYHSHEKAIIGQKKPSKVTSRMKSVNKKPGSNRSSAEFTIHRLSSQHFNLPYLAAQDNVLSPVLDQ
ncbi:unnamed protein product [Heterobilharzia americana]|nr:unnamed protein product [Heterobilharzia americana]